MSDPQVATKVFHITHVDNLPSIIADDMLLSDTAMLARAASPATIGMSSIKQRRLTLPVEGHPGLHVGDFVPFYFCPRSVMLFVIYCKNHAGLTYRDGQTPMVHLECDLNVVLDWAIDHGHPWAFSQSNAAARYANFRSRREDLAALDWAAIAATDFRSPAVKEAKQAEFLVHHSFPWRLVSRIGACSSATLTRCNAALLGSTHKPRLERRPDWYY